MSDVNLEYEQLACELLGLVHPAVRQAYPERLLDLGHFRIVDSPAATEKVIERYLWKLRDLVDDFQDSIQKRRRLLTGASSSNDEKIAKLNQTQAQFQDKVEEKAVLLPADFYQFNKRGDSEEKRSESRQGRAFVKDTARQELARLQQFVNFSSDFYGYCQYLDRACPSLFFRLSQDIPTLW